MSNLPRVGEKVKLFGVGCEGCGSFRGDFEVTAVEDRSWTRLVLDALSVQCESGGSIGSLRHLTLSWSRALQCWMTRCDGHQLVVSIGGHYHGPGSAPA